MNIWKQRVTSIIYFHYRFVVMGIIGIGGGIALVVVYQFLFKKVAVEMPTEPVVTVSVNQKAVDRVVEWNAIMANKGSVEISIPNSAFAIPTPPPN